MTIWIYVVLKHQLCVPDWLAFVMQAVTALAKEKGMLFLPFYRREPGRYCTQSHCHLIVLAHVPLKTTWSSLADRYVSEGRLVVVIGPNVIKRPITMQTLTAQSKVPQRYMFLNRPSIGFREYTPALS